VTRHSALIVDDERIARTELAYLLGDHPGIEVVGEASSVTEAVGLVSSLKPELVFLDVQMPGASGFELFDRVELNAWVIFVTAYEEFALRAFEVNALDYLTKPIRPQRLSIALERFLSRVRPEPQAVGLTMSDSILLTIDRRQRFVKIASISCIQAEGDYSMVIADGRPLGMVLKSMKEWENVLPDSSFYRIQRSTIVNAEHVTAMENHESGGVAVHLRDLKAPVIMSRRYARQIRSRFAI